MQLENAVTEEEEKSIERAQRVDNRRVGFGREGAEHHVLEWVMGGDDGCVADVEEWSDELA